MSIILFVEYDGETVTTTNLSETAVVLDDGIWDEVSRVGADLIAEWEPEGGAK